MNSARAAPHQMQTLLYHTSKGLDLLPHPVNSVSLGWNSSEFTARSVQHRDHCIRCRDIWLSSENAKPYLQVLSNQGDVACGSGQLLCSHGHCGNPAVPTLGQSQPRGSGHSWQSPPTAQAPR